MKRQFLFSVMAVLAMVLAIAAPALADVSVNSTQAGQNLGNAFSIFLGSNMMLIIGVAMAIFGLYEWLVAQNTAVGLGMIVFGVVVAFVPNLFQGIKTAVAPIFNAVGSNHADLTQQ